MTFFSFLKRLAFKSRRRIKYENEHSLQGESQSERQKHKLAYFWIKCKHKSKKCIDNSFLRTHSNLGAWQLSAGLFLTIHIMYTLSLMQVWTFLIFLASLSLFEQKI